jgi:putative ABC transport system ATP-binding protein
MTDTRRELGEPVARLEGVVKSYQGGGTASRVLDGVSLQIERGTAIFLAGPSGSGKTTLLSIIGSILSADAGEIEVLGHNLASMTVEDRIALRRDRIGFVFQRFHLIRGLTAAENVGVPMVLRGLPPHEIRERARALLASVGLADKANAHPKNLSAGQCQRVALARALANDPELILADEPTASLDATNGHSVMELLWRLTVHDNRTVVVVTHDPRIFSFADHIYWLENGRIVEHQEVNVGAERLRRGDSSVALQSLPGGFPSVIEAGV